ncbi:MAG: TetR/AcrR family transcriptional regulator [Alcaligenaceae bacterium]|nr:TetR/AcrR family transcriptional regulator [Alcaligenaceae bacterium]
MSKKSTNEGDTRQKLLDAAEQLFTQQGHEATSLRQITALAGANLGAVNYHFGTKEGLIEEVFKRRLKQINQERKERLDDLEAAAELTGEPIKASEIVNAFFGTLVSMAFSDEIGVWSLLERTMLDPGKFISAVFTQESTEVIERYKDALYEALPLVPREEILWRFQFMLGATAYALSDTGPLGDIMGIEIDKNEAPEKAQEKLLKRLMSFLIGGLRAPLATTTE